MQRLTRALRAGALALALLLALTASVPVKPWTFNPGQTAQSAQVNADFDTLYAVLNGGLDSTNISNVRGINASQIIPTTGGLATFGGAIGYTFWPGVATQVPLTVAGVGGQTADIFDVDLTFGGTRAVWVDNVGLLHTNAAPAFPALSITNGELANSTISGVALGGTLNVLTFGTHLTGTSYNGSAPVTIGTDCTNANTASTMVCRDPAGAFSMGALTTTAATHTGLLSANGGLALPISTITTAPSNGISIGVDGSGQGVFRNGQAGGADLFSFQNATGTGGAPVEAANGPGNTLAYVPPIYTAAGAATANTAHSVIGTCAFSASTSCTPTAFSGAAVFASATSYSCSASGGAGTFAQTGALSVGSQSTTGIIITAATSNSQTVAYICIGA